MTDNPIFELGNKVKKIRITPFHAGIIIGLFAAWLESAADMLAPAAYGICVACHTRDFTSWIVNGLNIFDENLFRAPTIAANKGKNSFWPVLTLVGLWLGSFTAAFMTREFKFKLEKNVIEIGKAFFFGFLVMIFALILGACPIRISLRFAHGEFMALMAIIFLAIGVFMATIVLNYLAARDLEKEG